MEWASLGKKCIVFGAGVKGESCFDYLESHGVTVDYFVDNNEKLWNTVLKGCKILPSQSLSREPDGTIIVIASKYEGDIRKQLQESGIATRCNLISAYDIEQIDIRKAYSIIIENWAVPCRKHNTNPIIFYDHQAFGMQKRGGISRYCKQIIGRMAIKENCSVDLFEGVNRNQEDFGNIVGYFRRYFGKKDRDELLNLYQNGVLNSALLHQFIKDEKYDIYHPTYYRDNSDVNYRKMVITVHDLTEEKTGLFPGMPEIKKRIIEKADGFIAVSNNTKKDLQEIYGIPDNKIRVIYEANSLKDISPDSRAFLQPYILYVGDRKRYKNWRRFLEAFKCSNIWKDTYLVCFGGGDFDGDERELIEKMELDGRVVHKVGSDELLASYYRYAEALAYPSTYEGFGLPVLEAMQFGCPVIASNCSSLPEVGGDAAYYFDPESIESMADAIDKVMYDTELKNQMKQKGILQESKFSWDQAAEQTLDFYFDILGR